MATVKLLHYTPLVVCSNAIRTCWQSFDKSDSVNECHQNVCSRYENRHTDPNCRTCEFYSPIVGVKDRELIDRVGNKYKHASTLEHLVYTFYIQDISRALLQELARHRIASLSVKSTRYTLKELVREDDEEPFHDDGSVKLWVYDLVDKYCVIPKHFDPNSNDLVEFKIQIAHALGFIIKMKRKGLSNDIVKYALPECYKTELTWTINARSLQNFLSLRSSKSALWEIRELARDVYNAIPEDHKYLFEECLKG